MIQSRGLRFAYPGAGPLCFADVSVAQGGTLLLRGPSGSGKSTLLRQTLPQSDAIYGEAAGWIRSEALMRLDLGEGRLPGLLVMGAEDPHHFKPSQGTDLLAFFAGVFERAMRRYLS